MTHTWAAMRRRRREQHAALPTPLRHAVTGAAFVGVPAGLVGMAVGLHVYAPTAWAAGFEVGVPGALVGGLAGLLIGTFVTHSHSGDG